MSEEQTDDTQSETNGEINTFAKTKDTQPLTDLDLEREIKILEEAIPKTDQDKFTTREQKEAEYEEGVDNIEDISEEEEKNYGI